MRRDLQLAVFVFTLMSHGVAGAQDSAGNAPVTRDVSHPDGNFSVVHGDPEKGNADVVVTFPAGGVSPRHWHTTAERMVLLSGEMFLTYDGHETMTLKPGSYAYGPAKLPHTAACAKGAPCVLFIATELPFDQEMATDADDDGRVSLAEYQDGLYDFDAMDRDHDQVLSPDEPGGVTRPTSRAEFRATLARSFKARDLDADGYLDAEERAAPPPAKPASTSTGG